MHLANKEKIAGLKSLSKKALAAAKAGDTKGAQSAVKEFVALGDIRVQDTLADSIYNPKQRRNMGAPTTADILSQMGPEKCTRDALE